MLCVLFHCVLLLTLREQSILIKTIEVRSLPISSAHTALGVGLCGELDDLASSRLGVFHQILRIVSFESFNVFKLNFRVDLLA